MSKYILCCSCHGMEKRAKEAFCVMTNGNEISPDVIKGKDRLCKFAKEINNDHILAISKLSGRFAYYVELKDNKITKEYDLIRGNRIA